MGHGRTLFEDDDGGSLPAERHDGGCEDDYELTEEPCERRGGSKPSSVVGGKGGEEVRGGVDGGLAGLRCGSCPQS